MATTLDPLSHHDDLNLMGLQELDSHLSLFESTNGGRDASTPGAMSSSSFGENLQISEESSHVISFDPREGLSRKSYVEPRAVATQPNFHDINSYVFAPSDC